MEALGHFEIPEKARKYPGKTRTALVVYIHEVRRNSVKNGATIPAKQFYLS